MIYTANKPIASKQITEQTVIVYECDTITNTINICLRSGISQQSGKVVINFGDNTSDYVANIGDTDLIATHVFNNPYNQIKKYRITLISDIPFTLIAITNRENVREIYPSTLCLFDKFNGEGFSYPYLERVYFPKYGKSGLSESSFRNSIGLTEIRFSDVIQEIPNGAFFNSGIQEVVFPEKFNIINQDAFAECASLTNITFTGKHLNSIGSCAFLNCTNLQQIYLPNDLEIIYDLGFAGCTSLKFIDLPDCLMELGYGAFSGSTDNLQYIISRNQQPPTIDNPFGVGELFITLYVPRSSMNAYAESEWGSIFSNHIFALEDIEQFVDNPLLNN